MVRLLNVLALDPQETRLEDLAGLCLFHFGSIFEWNVVNNLSQNRVYFCSDSRADRGRLIASITFSFNRENIEIYYITLMLFRLVLNFLLLMNWTLLTVRNIAAVTNNNLPW